jgi:hypothetical protein
LRVFIPICVGSGSKAALLQWMAIALMTGRHIRHLPVMRDIFAHAAAKLVAPPLSKPLPKRELPAFHE